MTNFRKTINGDAFDPTTGARVQAGVDVAAWIDSLPPLEPPKRTDGAVDDDNAPFWSSTPSYVNSWKALGVERSGSIVRAIEDVVAARDTAIKQVGIECAAKHEAIRERDALKAELSAAKDESTQQRERAKNAGRELELMQLQVCDYVKTVKAIHAQITEATKVADKACEERDAASRTATLELDRLRGELSALRAQREKAPAGLVADAKTLAARWSHIRDDNAVESLLLVRRLAACEPAAMLTVEEAIEAVHSMKERALGLDIVTVVNAEDALRKAAKS